MNYYRPYYTLRAKFKKIMLITCDGYMISLLHINHKYLGEFGLESFLQKTFK